MRAHLSSSRVPRTDKPWRCSRPVESVPAAARFQPTAQPVQPIPPVPARSAGTVLIRFAAAERGIPPATEPSPAAGLDIPVRSQWPTVVLHLPADRSGTVGIPRPCSRGATSCARARVPAIVRSSHAFRTVHAGTQRAFERILCRFHTTSKERFGHGRRGRRRPGRCRGRCSRGTCVGRFGQ